MVVSIVTPQSAFDCVLIVLNGLICVLAQWLVDKIKKIEIWAVFDRFSLSMVRESVIYDGLFKDGLLENDLCINNVVITSFAMSLQNYENFFFIFKAGEDDLGLLGIRQAGVREDQGVPSAQGGLRASQDHRQRRFRRSGRRQTQTHQQGLRHEDAPEVGDAQESGNRLLQGGQSSGMKLGRGILSGVVMKLAGP